MVRVRLLTRDGQFVNEVLMPPFQLWPEVICWGERLFAREKPFEKCTDAMPPEYREAFGVAAWSEQELREMGRI